MQTIKLLVFLSFILMAPFVQGNASNPMGSGDDCIEQACENQTPCLELVFVPGSGSSGSSSSSSSSGSSDDHDMEVGDVMKARIEFHNGVTCARTNSGDLFLLNNAATFFETIPDPGTRVEIEVVTIGGGGTSGTADVTVIIL